MTWQYVENDSHNDCHELGASVRYSSTRLVCVCVLSELDDPVLQSDTEEKALRGWHPLLTGVCQEHERVYFSVLLAEKGFFLSLKIRHDCHSGFCK